MLIMHTFHARPATRRRTAALLAAAAATLISAAPSAVAADPTLPFEIIKGTAHLQGTVRWHQRSVDVDYVLKTSSCLRVSITAYTASGVPGGTSTTSPLCNGTFSGTVNVSAPGTPVSVRVCLSDDVTADACRDLKHP
ncbi:hypothetical protein [Amycolatopsis sp. NPDC059657]|uniref:hypothetical protein n=1 Tax=Amycolatopsis sp. NPDC059657 TaxID=3346899 RepID=UPI003670EB8A